MIDAADLLIEISKKLNNIEEKDCDFRNNARWLELRRKQEQLWIDVAKERLTYLESKRKSAITKFEAKLINFYKDFISKGDTNYDKKDIK